MFDAWRALDQTLRRVCNFGGFEYGAIFVPQQANDETFEAKAIYNGGDFYFPPAGQGIHITNEAMHVQRTRDMDWYDADTSAMLSTTKDIMEDAYPVLNIESPMPPTGCVGILRVREDTQDHMAAEEKQRIHRNAAFALFIMWGRMGYSGPGAGKPEYVSEFTRQFLPRLFNELSGGLRNWMSLMRVKRAEESRRQLLANSVHGLKSSLHLIQNKSDIVKGFLRKPADQQRDDRVQELLKGIAGDLDSLKRQIDLANRFTVLDAGEQVLRPEYRRPIAPFVERCVDTLRQAAQRRSISIVLQNSLPEEATILCDPDALETAILALLDNTIKYSFEKRTVKVVIRQEGKRVAIDFDDFGQGIVAEDRDQIFDKFYRAAHVDPKRYVPGTGIGLTVAREIVRAHHGDISFTSTRGLAPTGKSDSDVSGFRTVFSITLPLASN